LNKNGVALVNLKNKKSIIVNFLEGKILQASEDGYYRDIEEKHCFEIGNILAKLHLASQDFSMKRQNDLSLEGWQKLFSKIKPHLNNYQIGLSEEIENYLNFIEKNWNHNFPKFAVHVDLFPDNVFFNEEKKVSGVIDFYFAASDSFIYDFAVVVCAWCFDEKNIFDQQKFLQLKNGYELVRKFSNQEEKFLKIALIGASMRFLLTRLHDMIFTPKDSIVKIKNPQEFLEKLRFFKKEYGN
jgi:homoserine kinase type II